MELSPLVVAYAKAQGANRVSSFGDSAGFSDRVDYSTIAELLKREVSALVGAPGFDIDASDLIAPNSH